METQANYTRNCTQPVSFSDLKSNVSKSDEMACLCTHDTSNKRETNQQKKNDHKAKMSCLQWKHKQFIQEMSK